MLAVRVHHADRNRSVVPPGGFPRVCSGIWWRCFLGLYLLILLLSPPALCAVGSGQPQIAPDSLHAASRALHSAVAQAAESAGGDLQHEHIHLVLAFSTGHFDRDPLRAQAARAVAIELVQLLPLIRGDRVSVYAFELGIWPHAERATRLQQIAGDSPEDRLRILDLFPLTPRSGTTGGHDTERALAEIAADLTATGSGSGPPSDYVVVLLMNDAASVGSEGGTQGVWGEDDPRYRRSLAAVNAVRQPAVTKSGASLVLPFAVVMPDATELERTLQVVIMLPRQFRGRQLDSPPRSARTRVVAPAGEEPASPPRPAPTVVEDKEEENRPAPFPWKAVLALLALGALGLAAAFLYRPIMGWMQRNLVLVAANSRFSLRDVGHGQEICHLAGPGYPEESAHTVTLEGDRSAPPVLIARIRRHGSAVKVKGESPFEVRAVDGSPVWPAEALVRVGERREVLLRGEVSRERHLPPESVELEVEIEVERERS